MLYLTVQKDVDLCSALFCVHRYIYNINQAYKTKTETRGAHVCMHETMCYQMFIGELRLISTDSQCIIIRFTLMMTSPIHLIILIAAASTGLFSFF